MRQSAAAVIAGQIGGRVEQERTCHGFQSHRAAVAKQPVVSFLNQFGRIIEPHQPREISMQGLTMPAEQLSDVVPLRLCLRTLIIVLLRRWCFYHELASRDRINRSCSSRPSRDPQGESFNCRTSAFENST